MPGSFSAEILKMRKRPATWVIALIFAAATILFGYIFSYAFIVNAPDGSGLPQQARDGTLQFLLPESLLANVVGTFASFGSALALVLGTLAVGSEYGWDTLKVALTQGPTRLGYFAGKLAALAVVLAVLTGVILALGAATSYTIASMQDAPVNWPSAGEFLKGFAAGWLILTVFAALGVLLAGLFRGTALAIALGLIYLLVLENIFLGLAGQNETIQKIGQYLPAKNSIDLSASFGEAPSAFGVAPGETVEPTQATLTLVVYGGVFLVLAALVFRRRDVT